MDLEHNYWKKQNEIYDELPYKSNEKYYSWQPARWSANKAAVIQISKNIDEINTICELGAGSAAFSLELYNQNNNLELTALDRCKAAVTYGKKIAKDLSIPLNYLHNDFFKMKNTKKYDLVLSLGVIEHFNDLEMQKYIEICKQMSNKYILIAIPNQESLIFKSYIKWCNKNNNDYEEEHNVFSTEDLKKLIEKNELEILQIDGFQMFLSESDFLEDTYLNNKEYINLLKTSLINVDKNIGEKYPFYNFKKEDIDNMTKAELSFSAKERLRMAFMTYIFCKIK